MSMVACPACRTPNTEFNAFCRVCSLLLTGGDRSTDDGTAAADAVLKGTVVSHYEVIELIGAGAMGQVYRAFDRALGRQVALKFLSAGLAGDHRAKERMRREAQAASALDHPAIATIFEVAEHDGRPFIAMMLYEGETLAAALSRGALGVAEVVRIGVELASALSAAHGAGIVHRDVKPANVMLTRSGGVKLVDFGLAKMAASGDTLLTRTGSIVGTVAYMAPEQLAGEVVDHRADLWSLGVLLYEAMSGSLPIVGDGLAHRILTKDPVPLTTARSDVPKPLARLVMQLLKKDPGARIQSAADVEQALRRWQSNPRGGSVLLSPRARVVIVKGIVLAAAAVTVVTFALLRGRGGVDGDATASVRTTEAENRAAAVRVATLAPPSPVSTAAAAETVPTEVRPVDPVTPKRAKRATKSPSAPVTANASSAPAPSPAPAPTARASFDGLGLPEKPF